MTVLKSEAEIAIMREAGQIVGRVLRELGEAVRPGVSTWELDQLAERRLREAGGVPTFKGYRGFPASICASLNEQVVHGIPDRRTVLEEGDILSIDIGVTYRGYVGDTAATFPVGAIDDESRRLLDVTRQSLEEAMRAAVVGNRLSDIGHAVQRYVEAHGFSVVRDFVGHGIGTQMHEEPQVPNFGEPGKGPRLRPGLCLAIEPMVNAGTYEVRVLDDRWTVVTRDGRRSAHFEHTIAIRPDGEPMVLTRVE